MSPRVYERKFDWDEASRLYNQGVSLVEIGRRLGVSYTAVRRIVVPGVKEVHDAHALARSAAPVPCIEGCGRTCTKIAAIYHSGRCVECAAIRQATTAREGELQCYVCREWKPDEDFPHNKSEKFGRRQRHTVCRPCGTIARREYRNRNKVPCADGCGRMVLAPNEQASSAKQKGYTATGCCRSCSRRRVVERTRIQTGENHHAPR
jgi:hypothetical protein